MASVSRDECTQLSSPRDTVSRAHDDHHRDTQQETLALIQPFGADGDEQVGPTCCYSITSTFGETPEMQAGEFGAESAWLAPEMCVQCVCNACKACRSGEARVCTQTQSRTRERKEGMRPSSKSSKRGPLFFPCDLRHRTAQGSERDRREFRRCAISTPTQGVEAERGGEGAAEGAKKKRKKRTRRN